MKSDDTTWRVPDGENEGSGSPPSNPPQGEKPK